MLMHSPAMADHLAATEDYFRDHSLLADADREIIILTAAREVDARYAWSRHEIRAHKVGVGPDVIEALRAKAPVDKFAGQERLLVQFTRTLCTNIPCRMNCSRGWRANSAAQSLSKPSASSATTSPSERSLECLRSNRRKEARHFSRHDLLCGSTSSRHILSHNSVPTSPDTASPFRRRTLLSPVHSSDWHPFSNSFIKFASKNCSGFAVFACGMTDNAGCELAHARRRRDRPVHPRLAPRAGRPGSSCRRRSC